MRLQDSVQRNIDQSASFTEGSLCEAVITLFDSQTHSVELEVAREGVETRRYAGVVWPSSGAGVRLTTPREGDRVIIGFLSGNAVQPVIVSVLPPLWDPLDDLVKERPTSRCQIHTRMV